MSFSVNTNTGAMLALQNLNKTNMELDQVQSRVNSGLKVSGAKDNAAIFAIAQNMRADVRSLGAVSQSIARTVSTLDVAIAAGEAISDILVEMKEKAVASADASLDTASRNALNEDFTALRDQIGTIVQNASFNGVNLIDGSTTLIEVLADADATNTLSVAAQNLSLSGSIVTMASTAAIDTLAKASTAIQTIETSLENVNASLAKLGMSAKKLEVHNTFIGKLQDTLKGGIGNLVDADLAEEGARLQALQVKQQLGVQALSIANSAPQVILSLFQ
jgi:flagellin